MRLFAPTVLALLALVTVAGVAARAQTPPARLLVTVTDQTGAVIPKATVTLTPLDQGGAGARTATTSEKGQATVEPLPPGRYSLRAEFPGFESRLLGDVRLRAGDNKQVLILNLERMQDTVTVARDAQAAAVDPRGSSFGTALTREQLEALSDDAEIMQQQLQDMAGPGAVMRIDSFEGGRLPPKAQIKSIHITRDAFAAENHYAGGLFIDIITQPGSGPLRGSGNYRMRDGSMTGSNPFTPRKGPEQMHSYGGFIGGSLIKNRSSFSLSVNGQTSYDTPNINAVTPTGIRAEAAPVRRPSDNVFMYGQFDYALTKDQTLRVTYNHERFNRENNGVGGYDLLERAFSSTDRYHSLRIQEAGPLGRRFFINTRASIGVTDTESKSTVEALTVRVLEAQTTGGAQVAGGRHGRTLNLASDLDYVRGIHSLRAGVQLDGGHYRSNDASNYIGTYTFESMEDFQAGIARSFTRRIGDPNISYWNLQAGLYLQDDIRISKGLVLSPGLRYEAQTHLSDYNGFAPRFGINWAPFKSGKTTIRGSVGIFYDWLSTGTYEQTLRVDGFRQRELNIFNPPFPVAGDEGFNPPTNRYLLGDGLRMARTVRGSIGVSQRFTPRWNAGVTYGQARGTGLLRGLNRNAPIDGVRPVAEFGNIVEVTSDAGSRLRQLSSNTSISVAAPSPTLQRARWNWRRMSLNLGHHLNWSENNSDGAFTVPATGVLESEWGAANNDVRHRVFFSVNSQALRNLNVNMSVNAATGSPYTIRTGRDDNGDLLFTDRPAGVGRNTVRGRGQFTVNGNFSYMFPLGKRTVALPPGISITSVGGDVRVNTVNNPDAARYRLILQASIQNLTNRSNYIGYNGTLTSDLFGRPTAVMSPRRVDLGMSFTF